MVSTVSVPGNWKAAGQETEEWWPEVSGYHRPEVTGIQASTLDFAGCGGPMWLVNASMRNAHMAFHRRGFVCFGNNRQVHMRPLRPQTLLLTVRVDDASSPGGTLPLFAR